ncbi:MAG: apolipoprotein N-acyltransferase [Bacteroidetes bacterium]|nr:apolipoprotein N-acyltransferase [Bacteroidota bacterium]
MRGTTPRILLSLLSGILLTAAWPVAGFPFLIFIAFIPLLLIEQNMVQGQKENTGLKMFGLSYLTFFIWNILTTWWIYNASAGGAAMAILANALLMAIVFAAFHLVKKKTNSGYLSLICFWIAFEYLHLNWDLSWPWLTLGNVFSTQYKWVQWYEYTGALGGSIWVLLVNVSLLKIAEQVKSKGIRSAKKQISQALFLLLLPMLVSGLLYNFNAPMHKGKGTSVVIVQPNIDPYNEKFNGMSDSEQLAKLLRLASTKIDATTDYLIAPETALASNIWENQLDSAPPILMLKSFLNKYPNLKIVIGASTAKVYEKGELPSATARKFTQEDASYDSYNTALQLDSGKLIQHYHKSKLVPGVEKIPFPALFKPFEKLAIDLGGTSGSLGVQADRTVFYSITKAQSIAPVICYESIYGEFVGEYIKNGAQLIFIITNDGWWGDTPGYKQHLSYASLRAIETRREIARSANTGTSAIANARGDISMQTPYWKEAVFSANIFPSSYLTFYVRFGDYLGTIAAGLSLCIVLYYLYFKFNVKGKK